MPALGGNSRALAGIAVGVIVLILLFLGFLRMGSRRATLEAQIQQEVTDSIRFASTIDLVRTLQARQDTITQKIEVITSVDTRRYVWPHLLDEIGRSVPAYVWLTQIESTEVSDSVVAGPQFTLQGNVGSTQSLTQFMKNLELSAFVQNVTLITSEQEVLDGRTLQRFSLEAQYQVPPPSAIETVPVLVLD